MVLFANGLSGLSQHSAVTRIITHFIEFMPILASGKKRKRQSVKRRAVNDSRRRAMREAVKEVKDTVKGTPASAAEKLPQAFKSIDKAAKRGVINKKAAARKKSRLAKQVVGAK